MAPQTLRLLIIDDDPALAHVVAMVARETLREERDMVIQTATTVEVARGVIGDLARTEESAVIVISDYHMPPAVVTGIDLLNEVRQILPNAKRILMTGRDRSELEPHVTLAELDAFLPKPFTILELQPLLERVVSELRRPRRIVVNADREIVRTSAE